jgi:hypothetical protein
MRRRSILSLFAAFIAAPLARPVQAAAPPSRRVLLPIAQGGTVVPITAKIYDGQIGSATAWVDGDGSVLVTFLSHDQGGAVLVGRDTGTTFEVLPGPQVYFPGAPLPAFDVPGLKQGPGMAVRAWGKFVLYVPNRSEPEGRYNLWRVVW